MGHREADLVLQRDDAAVSGFSHRAEDQLNAMRWEVLEHRAYSRGDFHIFGRLRRTLGVSTLLRRTAI